MSSNLDLSAGAIGAPTLVIAGELDRVVPAQVTMALAAVSYRSVEQPILNRTASRRQAAAAKPASVRAWPSFDRGRPADLGLGQEAWRLPR